MWNLHLSTHKFYNRFIEAILKLHEDPFSVKWVEKVLKEIALLLVFIASSILPNVMLYNRISAISKRTINIYLYTYTIRMYASIVEQKYALRLAFIVSVIEMFYVTIIYDIGCKKTFVSQKIRQVYCPYV